MCFGSKSSKTPPAQTMGAKVPIDEVGEYEKRQRQAGGNGMTFQDGGGVMVNDGSRAVMGGN